jgi:TfoX/Sxy family transcriptional regulator of competence genes
LSKLPNGNIRYKNSFFSIYIFEKGMMQTIVMDDEILVMRFMGDDYPIDTS